MFRIVIISLLVIPLFSIGQITPLNELFNECIQEPGFSSSEIRTQDVAFEWEKEEGAEQIREVLDGIESIRILKFDEESEGGRKEADQVYKRVEKAIGRDDYREAMSFSSEDDQVRIYFLKEGEMVKEFALVSKDGQKITLMTVTGDLDLARMMSKETLHGLWSLKSVYSKGKHMDIEIHDEEGDQKELR